MSRKSDSTIIDLDWSIQHISLHRKTPPFRCITTFLNWAIKLFYYLSRTLVMKWYYKSDGIFLWREISFFLLAGHKVDFIAPCGANKSTFWPYSRKKIIPINSETSIPMNPNQSETKILIQMNPISDRSKPNFQSE